MEKTHMYARINHFDVNHADAQQWIDKNGNTFKMTSDENKYGFLLLTNGGGSARAVEVVNNDGVVFLKNKQGEIWAFDKGKWNKQTTQFLPPDTGGLSLPAGTLSGNTGIGDTGTVLKQPATAGSPAILAPNQPGGMVTQASDIFNQAYKAITGQASEDSKIPTQSTVVNTGATPLATTTAGFQLTTPVIMIGMGVAAIILFVLLGKKKK